MTKKEEAMAKKAQKLKAQRERIFEMTAFERQIESEMSIENSQDQGDSGPDLKRRNVLICGIDEAGRGPFAGPVVAGAVILDINDPEREILYLNDSKKLSEKKREQLYCDILQKAVAVGVGYSGPKTIDRINILQATYAAMRQAVSNLSDASVLYSQDIDVHELVKRLVRFQLKRSDKDVSNPKSEKCSGQLSAENHSLAARIIPDYILADAVHIPDISIPQMGIIKGDAKSVSIAAGSIIAKVTRDHIMYEYDRIYPEYGFASHKGYGTAAHIAAIKAHGMTDIHRRSFIHF